MTPTELLNVARNLLERPAGDDIGAWPRAVSFLTRQALEQALDSFWNSRPVTVGLTSCTMRTQLICLPAYFNPGLAREISYIWAALSNACHYHPYELAPIAGELKGWMTAVADLTTAISADSPQ